MVIKLLEQKLLRVHHDWADAVGSSNDRATLLEEVGRGYSSAGIHWEDWEERVAQEYGEVKQRGRQKETSTW